MLSRELMGVLALGVLWVNAGLIFAVALKQLRRLRRLARDLERASRNGGLVRGEITDAAGDGARFAVRHIHQMGRAVTTSGPERILFTDGPQSFEVLGGALDTDDGELRVEAGDGASVEVWPDRARSEEAAACATTAEFESAYAQANRSKGWAREIDVEVRVGDEIYVWGDRDGDQIVRPDHRPLLVSMTDPRAWVASSTRLVLLFIVGAGAALMGVTALCLWPPHFGVLSTVGGALGIAYFLGVQPLGVAVRDKIRSPGRTPVGALWARPIEASAGEAAQRSPA